MRVVIAIISLVLFVVAARFVYLRVRGPVNQPETLDTILPVPSPSYFPVFSPSPSPKTSPKASGSPKPSAATSSGKLSSLPNTGSNEIVYLLTAVGVGIVGLKLRKAYKTA